MAIDWYAIAHGTPSDPKLTMIAKKLSIPRCYMTAVWFEILDYASRHVTRGHVTGCDLELIGFNQDIDVATVSQIYDAIVEKKLIVDGEIANWDKYQLVRVDPSAAKRKAEQRAREKAAKEAAEKACNEMLKAPENSHVPSLPDTSRHSMSRDITGSHDTDHTNTTNTTNKTPLPPKPEIVDNSVDKILNGSGSFLKKSNGSGFGRGWNVLEHLSLEEDTFARELAKNDNWDYRVLTEKYNFFQARQVRPPSKPGKAFIAWIPKFTKGRPPT